MVVSLAKDEVRSDLATLNRQKASLPEQVAEARKASVMTKLRRLRPGETSKLAALTTATGELATTPADIAAELARHWKTTFEHKPVDEALLRRWLEDVLPAGVNPPFAANPARWLLRRKDVAWAIRCARNTAPGPDGIAATCWRMLRDLGTDVLYEAARALQSPLATEALRNAYSDEGGCGAGLSPVQLGAPLLHPPKTASPRTRRSSSAPGWADPAACLG